MSLIHSLQKTYSNPNFNPQIMTSQKPRQKTDQVPDFFQLLRQQHGNSQYMRFYLQQDYFLCHPLIINQQNQLIQQTKKPLNLRLFMNRLIFNAVSDVLITNKFVYNNSRIMNTILQSGRDMILGKYLKKHMNWIAFLERKQLKMIKLAYDSLTVQEQLKVEYSVLSISNLILKLGINISKLSCILTQRKYTTSFLSIPTLSLLFLQYLMYKLFQSKQIDDRDQQAKSQFIRQLPRITYIKISQVINKSQMISLQIGEQIFFTSQTFKKVKNLQYLQFYQHQERDGIRGYERITSYEYIKAVNMRQRYGLVSPYGLELLFLMRSVYFSVIKDFSPDVILFVEDYDSCKQVIEPEVRALLLTELMENVTGKVFVLKEMGFRANYQYVTTMNSVAMAKHKERMQEKRQRQKQLAENKSQNNNNHPHHQPQNQMMQSQQQSSMNTISLQSIPNNYSSKESQLSPKKQKTFISPKQMQAIILQRIDTFNLMSKIVQEQLDCQQTMIMKHAIAEYQTQNNKIEPSSALAIMERQLRNDLSYISLALIQRTSFEELSAKSHRYIYTQGFLQNIITSIYQYNLSLKQSYQNKIDLISKLQISRLQISQMLENIKLPFISLYQDYFDTIKDLRNNKTYYLDLIGQDNQIVQRYRYKEEDHIEVYYGNNGEMLAFVLKEESITLLKLCVIVNPIMNEEFYYWDPVIYEEGWANQHLCTNPTYLVTGEYVYKAFGSPITSPYQQQQQIEKEIPRGKIIRANYRSIISNNKNSRSKVSHKVAKLRMLINQQMMEEEIQNSVLLKFQEFNKCRLQKDIKVEIPLLQKIHGWSIYDEFTKSAIFMGGYSPQCAGENWVNKYLHILSQKQLIVRQAGKTTNEIFLGFKNYKSKIPLFPFIYGIPFTIGRTCYILCTNGFHQNLTNSNKLFLTEFKLSQDQNDTKYGIISQRKLFVNYEKEEEQMLIVTAKQFIVHFIVNSYGFRNCYQGKCVLQTVDEGMLEIELKCGEIIGGKQTVGMIIKTDRQKQHGFEQIKMYFSPLQI